MGPASVVGDGPEPIRRFQSSWRNSLPRTAQQFMLVETRSGRRQVAPGGLVILPMPSSRGSEAGGAHGFVAVFARYVGQDAVDAEFVGRVVACVEQVGAYEPLECQRAHFGVQPHAFRFEDGPHAPRDVVEVAAPEDRVDHV